jgi:hypothetical protein
MLFYKTVLGLNQSDLGKSLDPNAELLLFLRKVNFTVSKPASTAKEYAPIFHCSLENPASKI